MVPSFFHRQVVAKTLMSILPFLFLLIPKTVFCQEPSLLAQMLQAQAAVVDIHAQNQVGWTRFPQTKMARNPHTGQLVALQGLSKAEYDRNGSGVVIHPSGIIVTNAHIVDKAPQITISLQDKRSFPATVVGLVNDLDIALLKIEDPETLPYVTLADSNQIQLGDEIVTIGSSALMDQTVSGGRVIGLGVNRSLEKNGLRRTDLIQTTVNLYEGDSGGPLFNRKGELIGLMTARETSADHSSFAVPSNKIAALLMDYLKGKETPETP